MNILVLDDEYMALERLVDSVKEAIPDATIYKTQDARQAYVYACDYDIDVAFLDIQMIDIDGITLGKEIKKKKPKINIVFTTGYSEYALDAYGIDASGYLLKPVKPEQIRHQLSNLRYDIEEVSEARTVFDEAEEKEKRIRFQCFKNFEIYVDEKPIKFKYEKSKELLAYLVDRWGAYCSNNELNAVLWEDRLHKSYLRMLKKDIVDTFADLDCPSLILRERGKIGLNIDIVYCDYYDWQKGIPEAKHFYQGEYMAQYSWAEITNASLMTMLYE